MTLHRYPSIPNDERNVGLDLMRALAIGLVVAFHTPYWQPLELAGLVGVELFFVLSGFLICQMLVERFDRLANPQACASFLANRWIRTLPLYVLFLALNVALTVAYPRLVPAGLPVIGSFDRLPDLLPFAVFAQNLTQGGLERHHDWFGVSWTLATEEWFYFGLPCIVLALTSGTLRRWRLERVLVGLTIALAIVAIGGRWARHLGDASLSFDDMYRRAALLRMDTFCYGMLAYLAMRRWPGVVRERRALLAAGGWALAVVTVALSAADLWHGAWRNVFSLSVLSVALAMTLPTFFWLSIDSGPLRATLQFVSTRTYALYLSHLMTGLALTLWLGPVTLAKLPLLLVVQLIVADLLYRGIERPILALRPRGVLSSRPIDGALAV